MARSARMYHGRGDGEKDEQPRQPRQFPPTAASASPAAATAPTASATSTRAMGPLANIPTARARKNPQPPKSAREKGTGAICAKHPLGGRQPRLVAAMVPVPFFPAANWAKAIIAAVVLASSGTSNTQAPASRKKTADVPRITPARAAHVPARHCRRRTRLWPRQWRWPAGSSAAGRPTRKTRTAPERAGGEPELQRRPPPEWRQVVADVGLHGLPVVALLDEVLHAYPRRDPVAGLGHLPGDAGVTAFGVVGQGHLAQRGQAEQGHAGQGQQAAERPSSGKAVAGHRGRHRLKIRFKRDTRYRGIIATPAAFSHGRVPVAGLHSPSFGVKSWADVNVKRQSVKPIGRGRTHARRFLA